MECSQSTSQSILLIEDISSFKNKQEQDLQKMHQFVQSPMKQSNKQKRLNQKLSHPKDILHKKKIKQLIKHHQYIDLPSIHNISIHKTEPHIIDQPDQLRKSYQLNPIIFQRNTKFIKNKINSIKSNTLNKVNKIFRNQVNITQNNTHSRSKSRQNLCRSVLKKLSSQLPIKQNNLNSRSRIYTQGCQAIHYNFASFNDQIRYLNDQKKYTEQRIRQSLDAYNKTQNQRMIRLLQRQQEMQQKYSNLKTGLQKQLQKKASKKLSKKDFYIYSQSLQSTNILLSQSLQLHINKFK